VKKQKSSYLSNKVVATILAIFCTFLWGSAYPAIKLGYELFKVDVSDTAAKLAFAGVRFFIAGLLVLIFYKFQNKDGQKLRDLDRGHWSKIVILSLAQTAVHYYFYYIGLSYTSGAKASILNGVSVFFSALLAHFFYSDDKISFTKGVGIAIGLFAVIMVNYEKNIGLSFTITGEGFVLMASVFGAIGSLYSKRASQSVNPILLTGTQLTIGGILLMAVAFILGASFPASGAKGYLLLLYMALLSSLAFTLWTMLLRHNKVSSITVFFFLIPVFGTLLSALVLKESVFKLQYLVALPSVAIGIYLVNR